MKRALALLLACWVAPLGANERITDFHSEIVVRPDGSMRVVERIDVVAEGQQIRRGIYRDFPTDYRTPSGIQVKVLFRVESVTRDGAPEPFHTERQANGVRVYVGQASVFLAPRAYRYVLTYDTDRQLGFFEDHDELYWNVTGNGWIFPIERVSARVHLPQGIAAAAVKALAYTGRQGRTGKDYTVALAEDGATV
jgi:hypothetical protein